jgi:hypothetical protein
MSETLPLIMQRSCQFGCINSIQLASNPLIV